MNLALWEMSQTAIKCVFLSRGDYFTSCGMKTLRRSLLLVPGGAPCAPAWAVAAPSPRAGALILPEERSVLLPPWEGLASQACPLSLSDLALLGKRGAVKGGGLRVGPGFTIDNLRIWVKSSGPQGAS